MLGASEMLTRERLRLFRFVFDTKYRAGIKCRAADALSRLSTAEPDRKAWNDELAVLNINSKTFKIVYDVEIEKRGRN